MFTVCWSAKAGSGTTVVTCAMALLSARHHAMALLVDLAGEAPVALGVAEPSGPGIHDWVASSTTPPGAIGAIGVTLGDHLQLIAAGSTTAPIDHRRWSILGEYLADLDADVFVDAGPAPPPALIAAATQNLLVTRSCYLAVRRAVASSIRPSGIVLVREPGRALTTADVCAALGAPVVAEVEIDPEVARAVDAGLLMSRLPRSLARGLREVAA